jgi:xanthine/uracil/vitamin C permease (AzgA family)
MQNLTQFRGLMTAVILGFLGLQCTVMGSDRVEMRNGERYIGRITGVTTNSVLLESESAGKIALPRSKVASISFIAGTSATTEFVSTNTAKQAKASAPMAGLRDLNTGTNLLESVQRDLLSEATPEATQKFRQMVGGVMTGSISVNDLKKEARAISKQARAMKADLGEEGGAALDSYLAILDNFLNDQPIDASALKASR